MGVRSFVAFFCLGVVLSSLGGGRAQAQFRSPDDRPVLLGQTEIYVADTGHHRLVRVSDMTGAGWTTLGGPGAGNGTGQFNLPTGIHATGSLFAALGANHIYVADKLNTRVVQLDNMNGDNWTTLAMPGGTRPLRVFFKGALYVTTDPNRLLRFSDIADPNPLVLAGASVQTNVGGNGIGWASGGGGLFVGANQSLFLAATQWAVRINGWPTNNPTPVGDACCSDGQGNAVLSQPHGIAVDGAGRIYVADTNNHRIVRFNNIFGDGLTTLGGPAAGSGVDRFNHPTSVAIHGGQIYVADADNNRIVRFDDLVDSGGVSTSVGWVSLSGIRCFIPIPFPWELPGIGMGIGIPIKTRWCDSFARPQDISVVTRR